MASARRRQKPERDIFHDAVKNALVKEGWTITNDPRFIQFGGIDMMKRKRSL
ncbi:MAG: element excision factor XisH family protein [candidate division KSB1 bacterium]